MRARRRLGAARPCHRCASGLIPGAQVFKAVRGGVQFVAVKVLHDLSEEQSSSFGHEIAVLKSCRHPNIVQFQARPLFPGPAERPSVAARQGAARLHAGTRGGRVPARTRAPRAGSSQAKRANGVGRRRVARGMYPRLAQR